MIVSFINNIILVHHLLNNKFMFNNFDYIYIHFDYDIFVAFKSIGKIVNNDIILNDKIKALIIITAAINKHNVKNI